MELHRIIFRVDFPPAFKLLSRWGDILELLNASKMWTQLSESAATRQVIAQKNDPKADLSYNTVVELGNVNGSFEEYPIKSLETFGTAFRDVNAIVKLGEVSTFLRVGARFLFLEPAESFEVARQQFSRQIRPKYVAGFEGELVDLSLNCVYREDDQFQKVNVGPITKSEYAQWFTMPDKLQIDNAYLADIDCYTRDYNFKTFDIRRFIELAHAVAQKQSATLMKLISVEDK